jgi:hypothetical protein
MADYEFRYRLQSAPAATTDGSGCVSHDIYALSREAGTSDPWELVPGRHTTVSIPADQLQTVMDMPHSTPQERSAKNDAYKDALSSNVNTQPVPVTGWGTGQLESLMDANDAASAQAAAADDYITVTLGQSYPVEFSL